MVACSGGGTDDPVPEPPDKDPPPVSENQPPGISALVYPEENQLCVDAGLTFEWSDATDPEGGTLSYQIQISTNRGFTEVVEDQVVNDTNLSLTMTNAQDYYWRVRAIDPEGARGIYSSVWAFYVEGPAVSNHIPFSPALTAPFAGSEVEPGTVVLQWEAADLDEDFLTYDLYFGNSDPPLLYQANLTASEFEVPVEANTTYYWKVHVSDGKAESIGEVWSFLSR